jgi:chloride channel 3/4/5
MNPYCRMGGTELVASVSFHMLCLLKEHSTNIWQLFAECKHDSSSRLCVDHPSEITGIIMLIGTALIVKGCLTIITFGIKLPGEFSGSVHLSC